LQKLDDAGLARPTKVGAWRGKRATEWRLMWRRCDKSGDLPVNHWDQREAYRPADPGPKPKPQPTSGAERQRRYRERHRNENRNGEFHQRNTKVSPVKPRRYSSFTGETQTPKNPIKRHNSSFINTCTHVPGGRGQPRRRKGRHSRGRPIGRLPGVARISGSKGEERLRLSENLRIRGLPKDRRCRVYAWHLEGLSRARVHRPGPGPSEGDGATETPCRRSGAVIYRSITAGWLTASNPEHSQRRQRPHGCSLGCRWS
jgi:hypothetical protein